MTQINGLQPSPDGSMPPPPRNIQVTIEDATATCEGALQKAGYSNAQAAIITDHLVDAELREHPFAGLARALSIIEHLRETGQEANKEIKVTRSATAFAHIDGNNAVGYLVAHRATELAIEKAKEAGVSVVGANGLWFSGNLAYYAEMAAKEGLVTFIASNGSRIVAPHGGCEPKFCTNPFCIGFPTSKTPVIWDIGTSKIMFAQAILAQRLGISLPDETAFDSAGRPTTNPLDVFSGALAAWGGYKGSGLAMMIQLLGIAAGSQEPTPFMSDFGFLVIAFDPAVLQPLDHVRQNADKFVASIRATKMLPREPPARLPFERSHEARSEAKTRDCFAVDEKVLEQLRDCCRSHC